MPTADQVRAVPERYVETFQRKDRDAWLSLFAPDAVHHDPVGTPPNVGREAIAAFWDRTFSMLEQGNFDLHHVFVCGDEVASVFTFTGRTAGGGITFDGVEIFKVDDDGLITEMRAYWDTMRALSD
jgi:steroid Delta-isomerase